MLPGSKVSTSTTTAWGKRRATRSLVARPASGLANKKNWRAPFSFIVSHGLGGRALTIPHPFSQLEVSAFYSKFRNLIAYYASASKFSIRRPVRVARSTFFNDSLHLQRVDSETRGVEQYGKEYEKLGSFFVYKNYRNIHRFFESKDYHRCESQYDAMTLIDVSKCFDSIYTHSIAWAILGRERTKLNLGDIGGTFSGRFDALMSSLNDGETHGIVIGPEFSRVFAEIILQSVDSLIEKELGELAIPLVHGVDYEVFRYVDDFYIFYNDKKNRSAIVNIVQRALRAQRLGINESKLRDYEKPIITELTIAKDKVSALLDSEIVPLLTHVESSDSLSFSCRANSTRLITKYKAIVVETRVAYSDLLNYTLAAMERKLTQVVEKFLDSKQEAGDRQRVVAAVHSVLETVFFCYSTEPRVNHVVRLCRMLCTSIRFLQTRAFSSELRHRIFKYIFDNLFVQLNRNFRREFRGIDSLYLLVTLQQLGGSYRLSQLQLARFFRINENFEALLRPGYLDYFSVTVLLSYVGDKKRYRQIRAFLQAHIIDKLGNERRRWDSCECLMLLLDVVSCPYLDDRTKVESCRVFGLDNICQFYALRDATKRWFTAWGKSFDLAWALESKRSVEVY
nr:antiviral reverse transcriptase Drt3b [Tahibacter aquaticus]